MDKQQLESMSDLMINERVAMEKGLLVAANGHNVYRNDYREKYPSTIWVAKHHKGEQTEAWEQVNYCAEPSDMMPLVFERGISLVFMDADYEAHSLENGDEANNTQHSNPLRAAAIVYLLINGGE